MRVFTYVSISNDNIIATGMSNKGFLVLRIARLRKDFVEKNRICIQMSTLQASLHVCASMG